MTNIEVGNRIKELRQNAKLTKNALANLAGISPTYIYQLENGTKSPTVEYLGYICEALHITLSRFFADDQNNDTLQFQLDNLTSTQKQMLAAFLKELH